MPTILGIRVVRSSIDGYGVITTQDFAEGDVIADVEGVVWRENEKVDDRYSLIIEDGVYMDMVDQTRWINHSCDPNCEVDVGLEADGRAWAKVYAARPIRSGEELTYDYGFPAALAEPCSCGATTCRGMIVDIDELHLVKRNGLVHAKDIRLASPPEASNGHGAFSPAAVDRSDSAGE